MWSGQWPGARGFGPGLGLKYDNCVASRAGPGHTFAGRAGPGPHNSVCGPGLGRVFTTAAGPGRAWASNHICGPGLGLNFQPVQGPRVHHCLEATCRNIILKRATYKSPSPSSVPRQNKLMPSSKPDFLISLRQDVWHGHD